ncbi:nuclear transport factor 2 family protein [Dyella telluris]|uniref:Nuclear transport factor 2 family protein n=1 Tax=Dyella telluris TaxID=2763498 RepID=A0A7G8Q486_9GAMM|nr:nuclear transport factor 2 family protein [Dyella telluris]QNK01594.1 nuclear transport factor 2 family protein [Dyella telluris]
MKAAYTLLLAVSVTSPVDTPASPRSVVLAMFDAFNRHDADAMARLYAENATLSSSDFCAQRAGRAEVARTYRRLFLAFPDIRDEVESMVVQDGQVAMRFVARSAAGVSPLHLPISTFLVVRQGQIVSDDSTFDTAGRPCSR